MRTRLAFAAATLLALLASIFVYVQPAQAAVGIRISNGRLVEANGTPLVLRGVNHAHTWFKSQTSSFAAIKAAGANAVRVVLSGGRWQPADDTAGVTNVINLCKQNRLICVLENHDTTGFNEQGGAVSLDASVTYWNSVRTALIGQENYVILNIGNEPMGNGSNPPVSSWPTATANAIQRLRSLGFEHTIMVDAPNWGQDWQFVMRDNAPTVRAADPTGNTIFSVHMYGVFDTAAEITAYLDSFVSRGLPLVVGEFGHNHSDGDPDENTIFAATQARNLGWMAWSWSGNGCCVEYLDMVQNNNGTFNHTVRSAWGERVITGANGLSTTSREATIYSGQQPDTTPPTTPGTPSASNVGTTTATLTWGASTDTGGSGLAGYNVYREQGTTDPLLAQSTTTSVNLTGLTVSTQYQVYVRARDGAGNLSATSALATFTTQQGGGDTTPPSIPGTPTASAVGSTTATLSWSASTDTGGSGLAGYNVYREQGTTDPLLGQSTTTSINLTGLTANTQYQVYVRARDGAGNLSGNSGLATFTTTGGGGGVSCRVAYTISPWGGGGGFTAGLTLTNTGSAALTWTLTFTLPSGQAMTMPGWSATYTPSGSTISAVGLDWNRSLPAGQGTTIGFNGTHTGNTSEPTAFSVNGTACTVV